jgi:polyisoprenoid-binding protein YceI
MRGMARVDGLFREVSGKGTVCADGAIRGIVTVATASIDTQNTRRDTHLRSADFFDSSGNPDIVFTAEGIRPSGQGVTVTGTLTVRGRTRPLLVDASASVHGDAEIWLDAEARINRADFGLTWNPMGMAGVNNHPDHPGRVHQAVSARERASERPPVAQTSHGRGGNR